METCGEMETCGCSREKSGAFSRLDLNQRFFGGAVLFVGFEPGGAAQHFGVVIHGHGHDRVVALYLPFPDLVGVIQLVAAGAHRNL